MNSGQYKQNGVKLNSLKYMLICLLIAVLFFCTPEIMYPDSHITKSELWIDNSKTYTLIDSSSRKNVKKLMKRLRAVNE